MNARHDHNLFSADSHARELGRLDDLDADKERAISAYVERYMPDPVEMAEEIMGEFEQLCALYLDDEVAVQQRITVIARTVFEREAERIVTEGVWYE